ncbi:MAG: acyl-CoA desaturase [Planctomycetes bacterium]|nr:acyl-CoA desaturase [Planctomycetota bacterium]
MRNNTPHNDLGHANKHYHAATLAPSPRPVAENLESTVPVKSGSKAQPRIPEVYKIQWGSTIWLVLLHIGALAAPWTFTRSGLFLALILHWATGSIGICLGFHRLLTHTGLEVPRWVRNTVAVIGTLAGEGGPISWTANHRKHHAYSDQPGDPHSPHNGPWWAHMFWLAFSTDNGDRVGYVRHWVPDLVKDKFLMHLETFFLPIHLAFAGLITAAGYWIGGSELALSWLVWVVCLRMVAVLHVTWFVNSASHIWGYKNYETRDDSRNLWWVAIVAYGEGWHNNHHALPRLAQHGHKWWEFDPTFQVIRLLRACGLAKNVVDLASFEEKKRRREARTAA